MQVYLLRHGEALHNVTNVIPENDAESPLTEKGLAQADEARESIESLGITRIISSPFKRAQDTAARVNANMGIEIEIDERIRERIFGNEVGGLRPNELPKDYYGNENKYGGDNWQDVYERTRSFTNSLESVDDENAKVLISGHGGCNSMIMYCLCEDPKKPFDVDLFRAKYHKGLTNTSVMGLDLDYKREHRFLSKNFVRGGEKQELRNV